MPPFQHEPRRNAYEGNVACQKKELVKRMKDFRADERGKRIALRGAGLENSEFQLTELSGVVGNDQVLSDRKNGYDQKYRQVKNWQRIRR